MRSLQLQRGLVFCLACALPWLTGCEKHPAHSHDHEPQELITTVLVHVWDEPDSVHTHLFAFRDLDGPGGAEPTVDTIHLHSDKQRWRLRLDFLNEAVEPPDTITAEIRAKGTYHQVFYELSPELQSMLELERLDVDANGMPLGLEARMTVRQQKEARGYLRIRLFHYEGRKTLEPGGETDVDVRFPVHVMSD